MSEDNKEHQHEKKTPAPEAPKSVVSADPSLGEMDAEIKRMEYEIKKQELAEIGLRRRERELALRDLEQRVGAADLKDLQRQNDRAAQGNTFSQQDREDASRWKQCTHKKGGIATTRDVRVLTTGGNGEQYAVIKHQMINGDIWVRCLRCGHTWKPPLEKFFYFRAGKVVAPKDGVFNEAAFEKAGQEYLRALSFETRNSMSGSIQCRFTRLNPDTKRVEDASDIYRDHVGTSTLR